MYEEVIKNLDQIEKNPGSGTVGQERHISVTAVLAKINIDLVEEMTKLRKTIIDLDKQNERLTKMTTLLAVVGVILALIQVIPIVLALIIK